MPVFFEIGAGSVRQRDPTSNICAVLDAAEKFALFVGALQASGCVVAAMLIIVFRFRQKIE